MKILLAIFLALGLLADPGYPEKAEEVAEAFAKAYEKGDDSTPQYVFYTGKHVPEMGGTPEELEKELLPAELKKNRKKPAEVTMLESRYDPENKDYGHPVWFVVYNARDKKHTLCLHNIDGQWKVDLSYLWMGDWYDWMPGY